MLDGIPQEQCDGDDGREDEPVGDEPIERVRSQEPDHERDGGEARHERHDEADRKDVGLAEERGGLARVEQRLRPGAQDDRGR